MPDPSPAEITYARTRQKVVAYIANTITAYCKHWKFQILEFGYRDDPVGGVRETMTMQGQHRTAFVAFQHPRTKERWEIQAIVGHTPDWKPQIVITTTTDELLIEVLEDASDAELQRLKAKLFPLLDSVI